ncbi:MAG: TonB-dependent receptor [Chlorobi bacterium]|nr:TonB-dependent receptor [Chlorobiota bacterium]
MKKIILSIVYLLFFSGLMYAQTVVSGKVTDTSGEPLPGVNVFITGTTNGTITNSAGIFNLKVDDVKNTELTFSFIGFDKKTVKLNGNTILNVQLKESSTDLDEVVIYSYGKLKKSDLTGSVSSVKIESNTPPSSTIDQLLQGKAGGVSVSTASAEPGASINVRIRGLNSISVSNQPLYVIDGIPMDVGIDTPNSMGAENDKSYSPLIGINPNDIESIEILKDASATAIYGSRGANGVVLITTKGGKKKGTSEVTFSSSITISNASETIDVLSPQEFAEYRNEFELVASEITGEVPRLPYDGINGPLPQNVEGYNWQDVVLRTAVSQDYNMSMTGSSDKAYYYLSFGASLAEGIVLNSSLDRYNFNGKYNWDVTDKIRYNLSVSFSHAEGQGTSTSGDAANVTYSAIGWMLTKSPIVDDYTEDNEYIDPEELETANPLTFVNEYVSEPVSNYFRGRMNIEYDLYKWLTMEVKYGLNYTNNKRGQYWPKTLPMVEDQGRAGYSTSDQLSWTFDALEHFKFNINKIHKINGVVGIEMNKKATESFKVRGDGFSDDALTYYNLESASLFTPADLDRMESQMFSVIARANYSYKGKYLLTATARYDGSSRFSDDQKYAFFPSFSAAWRVTEEDFMKNNEYLSNLKLRLSWGQAGNQGLSPYATLSRYNSVIYPLNGVSTSGYAVADFQKNVTWETSEQLNFGFDLGFFNNRLTMSLDVYKKMSKDILIKRNMPLSSGYTSAWDNMGQINNKGLDVEGLFRVIDHRFKWDFGGNFSIYRNEIVKLGLPESAYGYVQFWGKTISGFNVPLNTYIEGEPIGQFWGYVTDGLFQTQEEIDALDQNAQELAGETYYQFGKPMSPGDIKYVDLNGDGVVNEMDKTVIGNPNPDFTYGITNTFSYKNFSLNLFFTGVQGVDVFNANLQKLTMVGQASSNVISPAYLDAWRGEGTSDYWPRIVNDWQQNKLIESDRLVEDGSYFRLQTATFSYSTPLKQIRWISNLNLSVTGVNLFTITDYSWWNPEASAYGNDNMAIGIDRNSYPMARSFIFGLRVSFK